MSRLISVSILCLLVVLATGGELEWWQTSIIYQIYPRSFKDTDGNGVGDLQGIIDKLDYIRDLGVGAVWLSPIYPSPGADHGYDISNYIDIDPLFGDMDTFDILLQGIHDRGMYLMMDFVPNHSSDQHPWFIESRKPDKNEFSDYYLWVDGKPDPNNTGSLLPPNNWLSGFGGSAWTYDEGRGKFYYHQYAPQQPDLNYRNQAVVKHMKDNIRFWLEKGVDGFRLDSVPTLFEDEMMRDEILLNPDDPNTDPTNRRHYAMNYTEGLDEAYDMIGQFRVLMDEYRFTDPERPVRACIAEASTSMRWYGTYDTEIANFPFNFVLIHKILNTSTAANFVQPITQYLAEVPVERWPSWFIGSHDQRRVATRLGKDRVDIMNAVNLLLPGTAITYMGEEIGMEDNTDITYEQGQDPQGCNAGPDGYANKSRDYERAPFQWDDTTNAGFSTASTTWLPVNKNYPILNVMLQEHEQESHLKFYRELSRLKQLPSVRNGRTWIKSQHQHVLFIVRELEGFNSVAGLFNFASTEINVNATAALGDRFNNYYLTHKSVGSTLVLGTVFHPQQFTLPPNSISIFQTNIN